MTKTLPNTREELLVLHAQARHRRNDAPLGGDEFRAASEELAAIEIRIAEIEVSAVAAAASSKA